MIERLKQFLIELGRDFCFAGSRYPLQVGGRDFVLDLLFFNRALNCLVAIELKIDEFQPEHLGKLEFYLEALDRDVRKPHERPSVGVLLCATKDNEVDLIYINGGNNLENLKTPDDTWKVRLIEEDFHDLMFEMEGV